MMLHVLVSVVFVAFMFEFLFFFCGLFWPLCPRHFDWSVDDWLFFNTFFGFLFSGFDKAVLVAERDTPAFLPITESLNHRATLVLNVRHVDGVPRWVVVL